MNFAKAITKFIRSLIDRYPLLARSLRQLRDRSAANGVPLLTPLGFWFLGNKSMVQGSYEITTTHLIQSLLDYNEIFINIGANIGYYCCLALSKNIHTLAFEPITSNLQVLYRNIQANNWLDSIEVFPIALANRNGIIKIFGESTGASLIKGWADISEKRNSMVPVFQLDTLIAHRFLDQFCLILVDIEGAERMLLEGAQSMLQSKKITWIVEIATTENQPNTNQINPDLRWTFNEFWKFGYECRAVISDLPNITPQIVEEMQTTGRTAYQTYNYLFIHKENLLINSITGLKI